MGVVEGLYNRQSHPRVRPSDGPVAYRLRLSKREKRQPQVMGDPGVLMRRREEEGKEVLCHGEGKTGVGREIDATGKGMKVRRYC